MKNRKNLQGFTLIEILIVIGLIAILAAITIIALNPASNFEKARNSERETEMAQVFTAVNRWVVDGGSTSALTHTGGTVVPTCAASPYSNSVPFPSLAIAPTLVAGGYLSQHPTDPKDADDGYYKLCYSAATGGPLRMVPADVDGDQVTLVR